MHRFGTCHSIKCLATTMCINCGSCRAHRPLLCRHSSAHGLHARLQLVRNSDDGPEDAPRRMRGQGTLKMRRVWAYTLPSNDTYSVMHGEPFEGWYEFEMYDRKQETSGDVPLL